MSYLPKILIIAGSDPSGGAGIQTDIKTATANKTYASAAITCLTVQNTALVGGFFTPDSKFLEKQLEFLFSDIKFDVIKIGMIGGAGNIKVIIKILKKFAAKMPIILDPVMVATSGDKLFDVKNILALKELVKIATIVTPNINEAKNLADQEVSTKEEMIEAATSIKKIGAQSVLVKGGHIDLDKNIVTNIFLDKGGKVHEITNKRVDMLVGIHGTGCALATSIACGIAKKQNSLLAVKNANKYIFKQIEKSQKIGKGSNILTHF